jgi:predicted PurR-regulated permease PerM
MTSQSRIDLVTSLLFAAGLLLVLWLDLLPALIAGLLVYSLVNALVPLLRGRVLDHQVSRLLAVTLIAVVVMSLMTLAGVALAGFLRGSGESIPLLLQRMAEIVESSRTRLPGWLVEFIPENTDELQAAFVDWLQAHAQAFQVAGTGLGRALAHILIGMVIGGLLSLEVAIERHGGSVMAEAIAIRSLRLAESFRRVVFAQFWISSINTALTGIFLAGVLPALGVHLPFTKTLILVTFVVGLIPILGNLISNTVLFIVGLSQSLWVALGILGYLVAIHKLEYFLNARIVGSHISASAWELLLVMLVMEAAFGIPGLIAGPIYYAYAKEELRARGLVAEVPAPPLRLGALRPPVS